MKKGGVIKIYDCKKREIVLSDCGYVMKGRQTYSSTYLENNREVIIKIPPEQASGYNTKDGINNQEVIIKGQFYKVNWIKSNPLNHILLRMILTGGIISKLIRRKLKEILITRKKLKNIKFVRMIKFRGQNLIIEDVIEGKKPIKLYNVDKFSFRYIPSSRFYQQQEIMTDGVKYIGYQKKFKVTKVVDLENGNI